MSFRPGVRRRSGPYRSRRGLVFGVCRGIADYMNFSAGWLRLIVVALAVFTAFWPVLLVYLMLALLMKPEPMMPFETEGEEEFYNSLTSSRRMAIERLRRTYERLDRRLRRMEDIVTAPDYDWERRLGR